MTDSPVPAADPFFTPALLERRRLSMLRYASLRGTEQFNPRRPAGHAQGVLESNWLTSEFKKTQRKRAMQITPQDVVDVLKTARVKKWVLMGLYGSVGYLPEPRATQDVDVMIPHGERAKAIKALRAAWPTLLVKTHAEVVRFLDPRDQDGDGNHRPVIDLMMPWGKFQQTILDEFVIVDPKTKHRIPTLEAALVSKYAALISLFRSRERKEYDAGDFRRMVRANRAQIKHNSLRRLAAEVWEEGDREIEQFIRKALRNEPFPF